MAIAHLIHGFTGAGKTTYAIQLEKELPALRFSIDEWITELYGEDPSADKFEEYYSRAANLIWKVATRALVLGQNIILDFGFWSRTSRDDARQRVSSVGGESVLYYVTCEESIMRSRVMARTAMLPSGSLYIDECAIETFRARFEPLDGDESHILVRTDRKV